MSEESDYSSAVSHGPENTPTYPPDDVGEVGDTGGMGDFMGESVRQLPHDLAAEQSVLGGILLVPHHFDAIDGDLAEADFFSPAYGAIYAAMCAVRKRGQPIDLVMLKDELVGSGNLERAGGPKGLAALMNAVPSGGHVEHYASIVRNKAMLRGLIAAATEIVDHASQQKGQPAEILDEAESKIFAVATQRRAAREPQPVGSVLKETWEKIQKYRDDHNAVTGVSTGYFELDEYLTGFHEDELIIIAGRPAMGKSTFALNLLRNITVDHNVPGIVFTLEMSAENIARNMLANQSRTSAQKMRNLRLSDEDIAHLQIASGTLDEAPIWIDDTPAISLAELRGKVRRLKATHNIGVCIIDYLQLMTASMTAQGRSREQEVSEISRGLKAMSKELKIPVIALAQLSRRPEGRQDNRPILSDLRESGAIEQDADVVLLLHRPDYYDKEEKPGQAAVIIAKQRNGPTGDVWLTFLDDKLRFENMTLHDDQYRPAEEGGFDGG